MATAQRMTATDRRQRIVRAAGELFILRGYTGVSMEDVLAAVGGSKATLYRYFADKSALFRAAVEALCDEWSGPLHAFSPGGDNLADNLVALGEHFASLVLSPQAIALHRLVTAEAERIPGLGDVFSEHGPAAGHAVLGRCLEQACDDGLIEVADPVRAAAQLYQAMLGDAQMRLLTNAPRKLSQEEVRASIVEAVRVFLHGVSVPRGGGRV
ncbi:TetR/AcrR family transcriptional regulator [Streptomyces sp. CA-210063]|uniref:TetR/AcrR family transcriptional regulator n=1 Tax=Streptomyces sp. CA-210063 TaxID=2801029 RepID=UPI00214BD54F|nr:TetR/AcrR family transcriptional regulator [Streptomyces sp. CA-210063]UUU29324.1 TetR/AcrR family transcriptional regulator [Streptomyces sp. CA-210063]